ncbi:hypothetical protein [Microlunatus sp. Y2014]|uniref:hypothetical protein n=1 Tax=Microlunatus sp. Y2014 TaxID=3418488 RepID=UPI003DA6E92C
MSTDALARARQRGDEFRAAAERARHRRAARAGHARDRWTAITVDPLGQLVTVEFDADIGELGPDRWARSLLTTHREACRAIPPAPRSSFAAAEVPPPPPPGPATPGHPLAPEQAATRAATEAMVSRAERFGRRQAELTITGSAREVQLVFDGRMRLVDARTTWAALGRGPRSLADAVRDAWADARDRLSTARRAEGGA